MLASSPSSPLLAAHLVPSGPHTIYYIPSFLSASDQRALLSSIYSSSSSSTAKKPWTALRGRRAMNWGVDVGDGSRAALWRDVFPGWMRAVVERVREAGVEWDAPMGGGNSVGMPNNCLVNEYLPGQGIMAHEDGPAFLPLVATVSLGGSCILDLYRHGSQPLQSQPDCSLLLEPGSLLVLADDAYTGYLHGIAERDADMVGRDLVANWDHTTVAAQRAWECEQLHTREEAPVRMGRQETRVSLTFRTAKKVAKTNVAAILGGLRGRVA
ncbi:hypothetical protein DFJ77DRAFT_125465 [Powellomyces hirtus]|nr:hypothetical protein DFJ77DRAFT_125465 [Powellomyces hirtus]